MLAGSYADPTMPLIRYRPSTPLDTHVECFWWSQREDRQRFCEHMLPSGGAQLIFALHEATMVCLPSAEFAKPLTWSRGIVHGPQWKYYLSGPKPAGATVGVSFRPGGAGVVLGVPAAEIADGHVSLAAIWGSRGARLREQLLAAENSSAIFRILEMDLAAHLARPLLVHPAVAQALAHPFADGHSQIGTIQRQSGYSPRHFIGLFRAAVGFTPKHYYRVKRFNAVLRHLATGDEESLADIAASIGYSDQSHLTREFRELAGITPTQYQPRSPDSTLHHRIGSEFSCSAGRYR